MPVSGTSRAWQAVCEFADTMVRFGRDDYGPRRTPLFVGQLNAATHRLPAGTPDDPGVFAGHRELAGCQPFCQNLLFDFGLLDVLQTLTQVTGEPQYDAARRDYLAYFLAHCRHPQSGYFPWGEHVGYDLVRDQVHRGAYKGDHEVKVMAFPWDQLWAADPAATRHEMDVALHDHLCDTTTYAFNRHAPMDGTGNRGGGACSLACSAGVYVAAWAWLYQQTGEVRLLDDARRLAARFWAARSPTTDLFPSSEDRPNELWYADVLDYACSLLVAARSLGSAGSELREQALAYCRAYYRCAFDPAGPGFFDTLNIVTGQPVIGASRHYPQIVRPRYLAAWQAQENSTSLVAIGVPAAIAYAATGEPSLREAFDRVVPLLDLPGVFARGEPLRAGDAAAVLAGLLHVGRRAGDPAYLATASRLADHVLATTWRGGLFTSGMPGGTDYYAARAGSADLAAAMLSFALARDGRDDRLLPIRCPMGTMPW